MSTCGKVLLKLLDGKITIIYFFRAKCSLPPSKVSVLLVEIRLTKPHFDSSSLNIVNSFTYNQQDATLYNILYYSQR
jgi:hypothetical protein